MTEPLLTPLDYETRNLAVQSFAISTLPATRTEAESLVAAIAGERARHGSVFVQAKCSISEINRLHLLEQIGFNFIETTLIPTCIMGKNKVLQEFNRNPAVALPPRFSPNDVSVAVLEDMSLIDSVRTIAGESFTRDRFHMDPHCDDATANRRYSNWVNDLLVDAQVTFSLLRHHREVAGFMARKGEHLILAGFSRRHVASGFGDFLWLSVLQEMQNEGLRQVHTQISACNTAVLNLYVRLGFKFRDPLFILHFWSDYRTGD